MSEADLLRLLEWVPCGIAASAVVAVLALYELLAPNPRNRARRGSRPSRDDTEHSRAGLSVERRWMSSGKQHGKPTGQHREQHGTNLRIRSLILAYCSGRLVIQQLGWAAQMFFLLFAALAGAAVAAAAVWPYGVLIALLAAPFGGSASVALAGTVLYVIRSTRTNRAAVDRTGAALQPR